jgi:predicted dehydrogenase
LKTLIDTGYLGRAFQCQLRFLGGYGRDDQYGWRFDRTRANGILGDLGSHMVDFARWYVGDIARVSAHLAIFVDRSGSEGRALDPANDSAVVTLEFVNGAQGTIQVSAVDHLGGSGYEHHVTLYGELGTLDAEYTFPGIALYGVRHDEKEFIALPVPDSFWGHVDKSDPWNVFDNQSVGDRLFIDAIVEDRSVSPNFYDGWKVQQVIDAAIESHRSGSWVSLPQS